VRLALTMAAALAVLPAAVSAGGVPTAAYGPEPRLTPSALEARALELVSRRLAARGRAPGPSGALALAARDLAGRAAAGDPDPISRRRVRGGGGARPPPPPAGSTGAASVVAVAVPLSVAITRGPSASGS
jgi:hypothetical protein